MLLGKSEAHREEILKKSLACFQGVLKDPNFGDLFVGSFKPDKLDHLFISIQTFNAQQLHTNKKYNFEDKFVSLLSNTSKSIQKEIKEGFVSVPKGCYINLERKAKDYILENIKNSFGTRNGLISRITTFGEDAELPLTIESFVDYYHIDIRTIYKKDSFSRLCVSAGVTTPFNEPLEEVITKAFPRICAIDSHRWIEFLLEAHVTKF